MSEYHVGVGMAGIYAGTINKKGNMWISKSDVTNEAIRSVFDYYIFTNKKELRAKINGKEFVMRIVPYEAESEEISKIKSEYLVMDEYGYTDKELVWTVNMLIDKVNELNALIQHKSRE